MANRKLAAARAGPMLSLAVNAHIITAGAQNDSGDQDGITATSTIGQDAGAGGDIFL